jgi:hypothetical protein
MATLGTIPTTITSSSIITSTCFLPIAYIEFLEDGFGLFIVCQFLKLREFYLNSLYNCNRYSVTNLLPYVKRDL